MKKRLGRINKSIIMLIRLYQGVLSPWLPPSCRYTPTCSQYAIEAFGRFSFFKAFRLTVRRIASCRPGGGWGYDPVPPVSEVSQPENTPSSL